MTFVTPYVTDKFAAYLGDVISTRLSMSVWLIDDYTKKEPIGDVKVLLNNRKMKVTNLSGYYIFTDLAAGQYKLTIEPGFYFSKKEIPINIVPFDPRNPQIDHREIILKPKPSYPFPANATLVRGLILSSGPAARPVEDANISVSRLIETMTDSRGEFVLYFKGIDKRRITIKVEKDGNIKNYYPTIEEKKTKSLGIIYFP